MNILITGGAGFIGSTIADRLLNNPENKIIVIDNFDDYYPRTIKENNIKHNLNNPNYKLCTGDICDKNFINKIFSENKIDAVMHLAAKAGVRNSICYPFDYAKTNIEGTINILEAMKNNNVKKIVFASSSSVYGNTRKKSYTESMHTSKPISPYAASKISGELFVYTYSKLYDIKTVVLRLFTVFGPRQRPDLAICKFIDLIKKGDKIPFYGDGFSQRNYTYIDDVVNGFILALNYDKTNFEIFNIGGNEVITLNKMLEVIESVLSQKAIKQVLPKQIGDVDKTSCDLTKSQAILGYFPKTNFEEGIKKFVNYLNKKEC